MTKKQKTYKSLKQAKKYAYKLYLSGARDIQIWEIPENRTLIYIILPVVLVTIDYEEQLRLLYGLLVIL
ncbi:Uncharacterised protein [Streptococcus acidominimus]|uniref:Uncharacterized protein n=2 Tax=Streptococcus TaxID=1301 RepID=A0A239XAM5_STRAI|nr:hypothetical protein [Streptococcus acidominimus]SNV43639.1 Uncharacterised protein [Streptococcus acidominimus]